MTEARKRKNDHFVSRIFDSERATTPTPRLMSSRSTAYLTEHRSLTPSYASSKYHQSSGIFTPTASTIDRRDFKAKYEFPSSTRAKLNENFQNSVFSNSDRNRLKLNTSNLDSSYDLPALEDCSVSNVLSLTCRGNMERSASSKELRNNSFFKPLNTQPDFQYYELELDSEKGLHKENSFLMSQTTESSIHHELLNSNPKQEAALSLESSRFTKGNSRLSQIKKDPDPLYIPRLTKTIERSASSNLTKVTDLSRSSTPKSHRSYVPLPRQMKLHNLNIVLPDKDPPRPSEAKVVTLEVKGLKPSDDEYTIKNICKGYHILSVETDIDHLNGTCKGSAKIKVRELPDDHSVEDLKLNFIAKGIDIALAKSVRGKINHYSETPNRSFLDKGLQIEEHRFGMSFNTPKVSKMKNLESSDDLYGNSPGVGRWSNAWKLRPKTKDTIVTKCLGALNWERLGKVSKTSASKPVNETKMQASYMRSTLSYISKKK